MARVDKVVLAGVVEPQDGFIMLPEAPPVLNHPLLGQRF